MGDATPVWPRIEIHRPGQPEQVYELKGRAAYIGRAAGQEVQLEDTRVSRHHARVERRADASSYIMDLDSRSGTQLDGRRLRPFQPAPLYDGSRIKLVDYELVFRDAGKAQRSPDEGTGVLESLYDFSSPQVARVPAGRPAKTLETVLAINRVLATGGEIKSMLERTLEAIMDVFPTAERGFVLIVEHDGSPEIWAARYRGDTTDRPYLTTMILDRVLREGRGVLIADPKNGGRSKGSKSVNSVIRTALCVPLLGHDRQPLGMVQLQRSTTEGRFRSGELDLLAAIAVPLGVAVENHQLLSERASWAAAREIQVALLPQRRPAITGYEFWESYLPTHEVGGDLYDYVALDPSKTEDESNSPWAVLIGDVAGNGMPAALLAARISPEVRHLLQTAVKPEEILARLNRHVCDAGEHGRFVTMVLVQIDARNHELTVVNAGHMDPLVRRASGTVEAIHAQSACPPLGVDPHADYRTASATLEAGDLVLLYTDGLTDAMDRQRQPLGEESLKRLLADAPPSPEGAGQAILAAVRGHFAGRSQYDDTTMVCFGRKTE
jgi:serine phosphatase RsbU (regulator of sigma subunit)